MAYGRIYLIQNTVNDKVYVGQTTATIERRWAEHKSVAKKNYNSRLYATMKKYGADKFFITEVALAESAAQLDDLECAWIWALRTLDKAHGLNLLLGGSHGRHAESTREKCSASQVIRMKDPAVRENLSKRAKERLANPDAREKASKGAKARFSKPGAKEEHRVQQKGCMSRPEVREKLRTKALEQWSDPRFLAKQQEIQKKRLENRLAQRDVI